VHPYLLRVLINFANLEIGPAVVTISNTATLPNTHQIGQVGQIGSVSFDDRCLTVNWVSGATTQFLNFWLRDNCPQLRHVTTKHRVVETSEIPRDVKPSSVTVTAENDVEIVWAHDGHRSTFAASWLQAFDYANGARHTNCEPTLWGPTIGEAMPTASYPALCDDKAIRRSFLEGFVRYGVGILHDVPCIPGTVLEVASLLGELRNTSWGLVFDVISMEDANSIAYTNLPLVVHTDEGYRDPAPTVQLQHFLRADASGGESTLVDGFAVAEALRAKAPEQFALLANTILHFHFADATAEHRASAPTISLNPDGSIRAIRYSNHSVEPFLLPPDIMEPFYDAYLAFGRMRESAEFRFDIAMGAGDLYIVDNHRVMHGRTGFSSGGARHLQSCYIERDELVSRLTILQRTA
jgi:Taurine catabolism dioxygenase TauD, TfdA family/Gamma-butyrobetaine hydroxylase-like, N-terminal